ncbi:MAG: ABC transporter substrate-binding protein [Alphaproteobacteria bacterium]|nr:ABC transporter substrate-binding protein [Alphaproteobacteria bacterium]
MRRRDFTVGLLLVGANRSVRAQEPVKQHRIAVITPTGPVADTSDKGLREWSAFYQELRRWGEIEGQNLTVNRYSGQGRPVAYPDLARRVVSQNPDVIVAVTDAVARAVRAATDSIPIVWIGGEPVRAGLATSLARPGGNITGVTADAGYEVFGKQLQILKEVVPSVSKVAFLTMSTVYPQWGRQLLREISQQLKISLLDMVIQESTPSEYQRVFAEIGQERPDAIIVSPIGSLLPQRRLIVELIEKMRLPAIYAVRYYVEVGGLMAYASDFGELGRRMADDVHAILNRAKPGDIPIYQPTKYELAINLKTATALGLTIPSSLLAAADEVIE